MDVLYLSIERLHQLRQICSDRLLLNVFGAFADSHRIIVSNKEQPSGLWVISDFLKEPSTHRMNKSYVFVAFAYYGGFFQFEEGQNMFGEMNLLNELLKCKCILKEEYDAFVSLIYEARQGIKPLMFDLEEIENTPK